ncbi:MAG: 3-oxoacyl-ACP synthase III [Pirellulales bacterium]
MSRAARRAIEECGIGIDRIGAIVHASVCRDYLEPATSCVVHDRLGLPSDCVVYDCSNACLGFLNGMIQIANMIELGQIEAGLVVASEGSRELVETTIARLNADESFTRETVKPAMASLTIGSASAAAVLVDRRISQTDNRLLGAVARADTSAVGLCQSGRDESVGGKMQPLMNTDAEQLMAAGVALAAVTFGRFVDELAWSVDDINRTCCHQVGATHRRLTLEALGLNPQHDFTTFEFLGNTGSAAMPVTAALAAEQGFIRPQDQVALLGIGSGLNSVMIGVDWQTVACATPQSITAPQSAAPENVEVG